MTNELAARLQGVLARTELPRDVPLALHIDKPGAFHHLLAQFTVGDLLDLIGDRHLPSTTPKREAYPANP